jgi:hypothetical protein
MERGAGAVRVYLGRRQAWRRRNWEPCSLWGISAGAGSNGHLASEGGCGVRWGSCWEHDAEKDAEQLDPTSVRAVLSYREPVAAGDSLTPAAPDALDMLMLLTR